MSTAVSNYSYTECTRKASHQSQEQPCFTGNAIMYIQSIDLTHNTYSYVDDLAERSKRYHKSLFKNTSISAPGTKRRASPA